MTRYMFAFASPTCAASIDRDAGILCNLMIGLTRFFFIMDGFRINHVLCDFLYHILVVFALLMHT